MEQSLSTQLPVLTPPNPEEMFKITIPTSVPDVSPISRAINKTIVEDCYKQEGYQPTKAGMWVKMKPVKPEYGTEEYYKNEIQKAQQQIVRKELQTVARNELYKDPNNFLPDFECLRPLKLHIEQMNGINTASRYVFICVSPDPENEAQEQYIQSLHELSMKTVNKCWVGKWVVTYEQRGSMETQEYGKGIHINFLFEKSDAYLKKAPTDMCREVRNTFKHYIGENCWNAVDYRYSNDPTNFLTYFAGKKDVQHDPEVILADQIWRDEQGMPTHFKSEGWGEWMEKLDPEWSCFYKTPHLSLGEE